MTGPQLSGEAVLENGQHSHASIPLSKTLDIWSDALSKVPQDDKETLRRWLPDDNCDFDSTMHSIVQAIQRKREICEQKRWVFQCGKHKINLRVAADRILHWLERFKEAGDIAVNADPLHAGLPWAGVRFLLQVATSDREQMEGLLRCLNRIFYVLYRCQLYENLLRADESSSQAGQNLRLALRDFYILILHFLAEAVRTYEKNFFRRVVEAFWASRDIAGFETQCKDLESRAETEAQNYERYLNRLQRAESAKTRQIMSELGRASQKMKSLITDIWEELKGEKELSEILGWVSLIPYESHHKAVCKDRTPGTGQWVFEQPQYCKWESSMQSAILWLHGIPGAGKTKLISRVIDNILQRHSEYGLAYFYCNHYEVSRREAKNVLQSFVKQLAKSPHENAVQKVLRDTYQQKKSTGWASAKLTIEECQDLLLKMLKSYPETVLVLDALDECLEDRVDLLECLDQLVSQTNHLKVVISSRRDDDIKRRLENGLNLGVEATNNEDDIGKFVNEKIEIGQRRRRKLITDDLRDEIVNTLLQKSQGMFQWVALQVDQILRLELEGDIRQRLGRLPRGLKRSYDEIMGEIEDPDEGNPDIGFRALQWVHFSYAPLRPNELVELVRRDREGKIQHQDLTIYIILDFCRNLLVVDHENDACRFCHFSVQEYLDNHYHGGSLATNPLHDELATVAIACLLELEHVDISRRWLFGNHQYRYAAMFWHRHARAAFESGPCLQVQSLANKLLTFANWLMIYLHENQEEIPSHHNRETQARMRGGPLYWASLLGLECCVEHFLSTGTTVTREGSLGSAIVAAASNCHSRITRMLLERSRNVSTEDCCLIMEMIDGDMSDTLIALLDSGCLCSPEGEEDRHAKWIKDEVAQSAASNSRCGGRVMEILLEKGGAKIAVTEAVINAAAKNPTCGGKVIMLLLCQRSIDATIESEAAVKSAINLDRRAAGFIEIGQPITEGVARVTKLRWVGKLSTYRRNAIDAGMFNGQRASKWWTG